MLLRNQHQKYYPKCRHPPIMNVEVWHKFQFGRESLKVSCCDNNLSAALVSADSSISQLQQLQQLHSHCSQGSR